MLLVSSLRYFIVVVPSSPPCIMIDRLDTYKIGGGDREVDTSRYIRGETVYRDIDTNKANEEHQSYRICPEHAYACTYIRTVRRTVSRSKKVALRNDMECIKYGMLVGNVRS